MEHSEIIKRIFKEYGIKHEVSEIEQISTGNINDTYRVRAGGEYYTVQRVNIYVFKHPVMVMENIKTIADYIDDNNIEVGECDIQRFLTAPDGKNYRVVDDDSFWRVAKFVDGVTYNTVTDSRLMYNAGFAFGNFQNLLDGIDMNKLHETIPGFHDTKKRFDDLFESVEEDAAGRVLECKEEIAFLEEHREMAGTLMKLFNEGKIPARVTHNDTKYNNIIINPETGRAVCVIDLDTVMPGIVMNDFGDAIRFAANTTIEDDPELDKVSINLKYFEKFTHGYMDACGSKLTQTEKDNLALGAIILTIELAARFLKDYLDGDKYFKIMYPAHNLVRTRNQIRLTQDMLKHYDEMKEIVSKYC